MVKVISESINRAVVLYRGQYYVVSKSDKLNECLIFKSNKSGEIQSWYEVGGGPGFGLADVLVNFSSMLKR